MSSSLDTVVIGGGVAGLSAALVLGRARRDVLLVDAGEPSNAVAHGIGGMLGHDGRPPAELYAESREHMVKYPSVEIRPGSVLRGTREGEGFRLELDDGTEAAARTVLLATGMDYSYPALPGADERWGHTVFHCPFCHGWEVNGRPLGVLVQEPAGAHRAVLLTAWSDEVTVFTGGAELDSETRAKLASVGIAIEESPIRELHGPGSELETVELEGGVERPLGGLLVPVTLHQRSRLATELGAEFEPGPLSPEVIAVDKVFRTNVPGLLAAGDVSTQMPSVAASIAAGSVAGATIVGLLTGAI